MTLEMSFNILGEVSRDEREESGVRERSGVGSRGKTRTELQTEENFGPMTTTTLSNS
jgi:hypothetical protein